MNINYFDDCYSVLHYDLQMCIQGGLLVKASLLCVSQNASVEMEIRDYVIQRLKVAKYSDKICFF